MKCGSPYHTPSGFSGVPFTAGERTDLRSDFQGKGECHTVRRESWEDETERYATRRRHSRRVLTGGRFPVNGIKQGRRTVEGLRVSKNK